MCTFGVLRNVAASQDTGFLVQVTSSVIGRNCHIGKEVHIKGCYIQDSVRVGDGARLTSAMVCEGAVIMHDAVLHPGCIVSFQVHPRLASVTCLFRPTV